MKKFITTLFVGFFGLVLLNSCSEYNEEPMSVKTALIGEWNTSMRESNWKSINLKQNGTMEYGYDRDNAYWAFDEASQTISMYTKDGYYAFTYKVVMSDGFNSWAGVDLVNGRTYSFVRK